MAWQLLAAQALPYVAKGIGQALNKPKEEDFKPNTKYMEKYLSHLKGQSASKEAMHLAMQPAMRAIGAESRKTKQELGYQAAKTGMTGSGVEAQMKLSAGQGTQQALAQATERASATEAARRARLGEQVAQTQAGIEQEQERASQAFKQAKDQWKQENVQLGVQALGAVAGAGLQQSYQTKQAEAYTKSIPGFSGQAEKMKEMGMSPTAIADEAKLHMQTMSQVSGELAKEGIIYDPYSMNIDDIAQRADKQNIDLYYEGETQATPDMQQSEDSAPPVAPWVQRIKKSIGVGSAEPQPEVEKPTEKVKPGYPSEFYKTMTTSQMKDKYINDPKFRDYIGDVPIWNRMIKN